MEKTVLKGIRRPPGVDVEVDYDPSGGGAGGGSPQAVEFSFDTPGLLLSEGGAPLLTARANQYIPNNVKWVVSILEEIGEIEPGATGLRIFAEGQDPSNNQYLMNLSFSLSVPLSPLPGTTTVFPVTEMFGNNENPLVFSEETNLLLVAHNDGSGDPSLIAGRFVVFPVLFG